MLCTLACAAPAPERAPGQVPEWTLRRSVTIGQPDHPVYGLSDVGDVLAAGDLVYILMRQERTIRVFTQGGEFVRDLGRGGEGPGELASPAMMGWRGPETIWVSDVRLRHRFTFLDVATGDAETVSFRVDATAYREGGMTGLAGMGVRFLAAPRRSSAVSVAGTVREPIVVADAAGAVRDTLALRRIDGDDFAVITAGIRSDGRAYRSHPLPASDMLGLAPDGSGAVIVDRRSWTGSGSAEFGVTRVDSWGDTLFHRRFAYEPLPVPAGYFDREIEQELEDPSGFIVDRREYAEALRAFYERRRYFPPVTSVLLAANHATWLAGPEEGGERGWLVLDPSGSTTGSFRLPADSYIRFATATECWVDELDDFDIPYLVRYDIVP
ncbi:hypothetical protein [Candidatus Palauibacter sp.]|uniref:hypothetical protein n=1 Tax=Candidatus Palauibacter sp. TaxID=3101350 RepID=UPI003B52716C